MENYIYLYRIYEISEEIRLDQIEKTISQEKPTSRMRLSKTKPKSIHITNPPVLVELGEEYIDLNNAKYQVSYYARIYDLGSISVIMRITLPADYRYTQLHSLAVYLYNDDALENVFQDKLAEFLDAIKASIVKRIETDFVEDYTIYYFRNWDLQWDPIPLLLAETENVCESFKKQVLSNSLSYGEDDLTIITWDSALVYDPSGSADIPDLLEFANVHLLELRYYDDLLSQEMDDMYKSLESSHSISNYWRSRHYRKIMNKMMELVIDISEITERIHNSLKLTEDVFYARVYSSALNVFKTKAWEDSINRKTAIIQQNYTMLSNEVNAQQSNLLELTIVLLILIEVILALLGFY